jgi:hypothetical protein
MQLGEDKVTKQIQRFLSMIKKAQELKMKAD